MKVDCAVFGGPTRTRRPVYVKKLASIGPFIGPMKSVSMSGSPALVICIMVKIDMISERTLKAEEDMSIISVPKKDMSIIFMMFEP